MKSIIIIGLIAIAFAGCAFAQENVAVSNAASKSAALSASGAITGPQQNTQGVTINQNVPEVQSIQQRLSGTSTVKNVPQVYAPALTTTLTET